MKSGESILHAAHSLRMASEFFQDVVRSSPGTKGAEMCRKYVAKIEWIANDLITHPILPQVVRDGIKSEWNCDVFAIPAITEKIVLLAPEQREALEIVIDQLLTGQSLKVEYSEA